MLGSLGVITLTTGTPVRITAHAGAQVQLLQRLPAMGVRIQVRPDNASPVYVGFSDMQQSPDGPDLLAVLAKPVSATTGPFDFVEFSQKDFPAGLNLYDIFVEGATSDGVIVSYTAN